jgi:hypothetical protein
MYRHSGAVRARGFHQLPILQLRHNHPAKSWLALHPRRCAVTIETNLAPDDVGVAAEAALP